jgi:hypothetical protein
MPGEHESRRALGSDPRDEIRSAGYVVAQLDLESPISEDFGQKGSDGCFTRPARHERWVSRIDSSQRAGKGDRVGARDAFYFRAFFEPPFFGDFFAAADFLGAGFLAAGFLGAGFFGAAFLGAAFFAAGFAAGLCETAGAVLAACWVCAGLLATGLAGE